MTLLSIIAVLYIIMSPIANISSFLNIMRRTDPKRQQWILFREMLIALGTTLLFYFLGIYVLKLLNVSELTVRLASGIILFLVALKILFPGNSTQPRHPLPVEDEPFIVPIAVPMVAGPALIATVMLYAGIPYLLLTMLPAIFIAWLLAYATFYFSSKIQFVLKDSGLLACERLSGMILVLLSVQRFMEGVHLLVIKCMETVPI